MRHPDPLKLGIAGVGSIAQLMASAARATDSVEVLACASRNRASARRFARTYGIACSYGSFDGLLTNGAVDSVYIATPNGLHHRQTLLALAAGKHVLVEKPVALAEPDALEMARAADERGLVLGVGFHLRHHAVICELKRLLDGGAIGAPRLIRASWGARTLTSLSAWKHDPRIAGGGAIMGIGVHLLDLCCWLLNREPDAVSAVSDATAEEMDQIDLIGMSFGDCLADIQVTRRFELRPTGIVLHGTNGSLTAEWGLTTEPEGRLIGPDGTELLSITRSPYISELEAFAAAARGGPHFHADGWDGVLSARVTEAVQRAATDSRRLPTL